MPTIQELRDYLIDNEEVLETSAARTVKALRKFFKRFATELKAGLADQLIGTDELNLQSATLMAADLLNIVQEAGIQDFVAEYRRELAATERSALRYYVIAGLSDDRTLSGFDRRTFTELINLNASELVDQIDYRILRPIEAHIINTSLSVTSRADAIAQITAFISDPNAGIFRRDGQAFIDSNIETLVSESFRRFNEHVRAKTAEELGLELFVYVGPNDRVTRTACRAWLQASPHGAPAIYKKKDLTMPNMNKIIDQQFTGVKRYEYAQGDPLTYRGGFNCRHSFMPIDEDTARELGYSG